MTPARTIFLLAAAYLFMGVISFVLYAADKRAARLSRSRISERTLLTMDLLFGIIGGLLARRTFRHKTRKRSYRVATFFICLVHLAAWAWLAVRLIR